jgi:glycosyltransferase involved in cell wall biosynthesis
MAMSSRPTLICFAGDRWHGNPHSRHHLMRRFTRDFEVLFVEGLLMRSISELNRIEVRRVWQKLRAGVGLHTPAPSLHVLAAPPIPPAGAVGRLAQLEVLAAMIRFARRRLRLSGTAVTWFSVPVAAPLLSRFGERGSVFFYQDRYEEFSGVNAGRLRTLTAQLARGCDITVATSVELVEDLRRLGADPMLMPHGVEVERFSGDPPVPAELAALERPLVGYVGIIDDYLSLEAITATAEQLDRGTVVLVGRANTDLAMLNHPRIRLLGFRPYEQIPAYLAAFDCCICPFQINRLTTAVNPIKLREYLAAGRPVVASPLPAVREYADVVEMASGPGEFAMAVSRLLEPSHDTPGARAMRRRRVQAESWDAAAERLRPMLLRLAGVDEATSSDRTSSRGIARILPRQ